MSSNIQQFNWKGMNRQGARISGTVQAADIKAAEAEIRAMGVELISIKQKGTSTFFSFRRKRVKPKEIMLFTRYLSTMISAGLPILRALEIIAQDQENETLKSVITSVHAKVSAGSTFADALEQFPEYFDTLYTNLTRAGEKSATLDKVLFRIVTYLEKIERVKSKVKHALIYPVAIVIVATGVCLILLLFVIPQFQKMFESAHVPLPAFTRFIIYLSQLLSNYWYIFLIVVFGSFQGARYLKRNSEKFSDKYDKMMLRLFVLGNMIRKSIIARFTRTLAITLDAGLPIVDSMRTMIKIMGNRTYSKGIEKICADLEGGHQLASSLASTGLFPNMVTQMISVGEESGRLGEMLNNVASYYEEEVDSIADNLSTLLEPIILSVLGVIIGAFIIAMYLPIFKLGTTI